MDILRFATAGSVDDGKSTLIGRLLYDTKTVFADQIEAVERVSRERGDEYVDAATGLPHVDVAIALVRTPRPD